MARPSDPAAKMKLLAAAEAEFVARGLDGAKVEDITERAGLSKGSFYLHFDSKEDAFRHLVEAMLGRLYAHLGELSDDCGRCASVPEFIDLWVKQDLQIFDFIWQNRRLCSLLLEGGKSAAYRHLVDQFCDCASDKARRHLQSGIAAGLYRADLDLDVAATFMAGSYDRLARLIVRERRRPDIEGMLRKLQFLILRGIASADTLASLEPACCPGPLARVAPAKPARPEGEPRARTHRKRVTA